MILNNSELSTGLVYTRHGSAQSQGLPCSASFEKVRACSHILSHSLKGWLRLRVRTSVTIPRLGIEFDEAVLNLVVLDSVQNVIASRSFRIDFRTHGRPAATRSFRFYLAIVIISAQFHIPWVVRAPISVPNVTRRIFPRVSAMQLGICTCIYTCMYMYTVHTCTCTCIYELRTRVFSILRVYTCL